LKAEHLHIAVVVGGLTHCTYTSTMQLFKSRREYLRITVAVGGPFESSVLNARSGCWVDMFPAIGVDNTFFTKNEKNLHAKHLEGGP